MRLALDARPISSHFPGISRYVANLACFTAATLTPLDSLTLLVGRETQTDRIQHLKTNKTTKFQSVRSSLFSFRQQLEIPRILNRIGCDVYHASYFIVPLFSRIPSVLTVYDTIPLLFSQEFPPTSRLVFSFGMSLALRSCAKIITISECSRQDIIRYFQIPKENIDVVYPGVDPVFQPAEAGEIRRIREHYGLNGPYVLSVGSNRPHKNLERLIEAFQDVSSKFSDLHLVITGSWDTRFVNLPKKTKQLGIEQKVRILGGVPDRDLVALYSGARGFINPSLYEGFGFPIIEAMACGTPVACSNAGAIPEVAADAAILFDGTKIESIVEGLVSLVSNDQARKKLKKRGLDRARQFNWGTSAKTICEIYQDIAR